LRRGLCGRSSSPAAGSSTASSSKNDWTNNGNFMKLGTNSRRAVAIVTGGSSRGGRDVAVELARRTWPIVVVYLEHQPRAEATVAEIIAAGGTTVAVRADLADDLDVQRLFSESIAAFGGIDVVVHTTKESAALLYRHAARHIRQRGAIVSTSSAEPITPEVASQLREREITVGRAPPDRVLSFLETCLQRITDETAAAPLESEDASDAGVGVPRPDDRVPSPRWRARPGPRGP
jgi:short subunit dehydrogenase